MYRSYSTQGRSGISVLARFMGNQATDGGTCSPLLRCWYKDLTACSTQPGECNLRYANDSLRSNRVSKLGMVFEKELGVVDSWSSTLRILRSSRWLLARRKGELNFPLRSFSAYSDYRTIADSCPTFRMGKPNAMGPTTY